MLPTLSAEEVEAKALELFTTNVDCSLPCWWGITPGVSTIDEARLSFEPFFGAVFGENGFENSNTDGSYYMHPLSSGLRIGIDVLAKNNIVSLVYIQTEMTKDTYNKIYDDLFYQEIMSAYTLETVLTKYGRPDQILIRSFSELAGEFNPTQTLMYYPEMGMVVQYFSPNGLLKENDAFVRPTCPPKGHISLRLFNPDSQMSLNQLLAINDSFPKYKDISEATNMNIETFFQAYHEYDEKALKSSCPASLKTPENIWPSEYSNP